MIIGELSARTGVSARSLRYYEQQGLLAPARGTNGYRYYDDDAVAIAQTIRSMYNLGFSSDVVRTVLPCATGDHDAVDPHAVRDSVARLHDEVAARITELTQTREALARFLEQRPV